MDPPRPRPPRDGPYPSTSTNTIAPSQYQAPFTAPNPGNYAPPPPTDPQQRPNPAAAPHWYAGPEPAAYDYDDVDAEAPSPDAGEPENDLTPEGRDAKRRRIARACDSCRRKKIKCDGQAPKCSHCLNYKTECIFTQVEKKRAPPKGAKYIEGLENRLGRMESLLKLSGLLAEDDGGRTDLGTLEKRLVEKRQASGSASESPRVVQNSAGADRAARGGAPQEARAPSTNGTPTEYQQRIISPTPANATNPTKKSSPTVRPSTSSPHAITAPSQQQPPADPAQNKPKEVDALADQMCSLITNNVGETRYIGSSSGFSIFSPQGIQWVNEKTGDASFQSMIASATSNEDNRHIGWDHWKPEVFNDLFDRKVFKPLPPRQECEALLKDYFEHFNQMFPLFHEPTFMHLVDRQYHSAGNGEDPPYDGSGWWASLNVALAIAHRLRVMSNVVGAAEDAHAWGYLKNALAVMAELTMRNTDLLSVQALLGMALFLQGTPNPQPSFFLVAAAIRLAHSIGLHKRGSGFGLNGVESEQRKRVFWIAYLLDKDICLRSGRPPSQDDDDMNVELPSEDPPDNIGNVPLDVNNDNAGPTNGSSTADAKESGSGAKSMNLFRLMCTFAQIQSRVYKHLYSVRASRQSDGELLNTIGSLDTELETWKNSIPLPFRPENPILASHTPLILHVVCLHFAYYNCLTTIHRMLVLYYPVSALVTIFANILQNPSDIRARSDLKLMSSVVSFLTMLERDVNEANGNVRRMLSVCAEFERIARVVLDKAERELRSGRGKRKVAGSGLTERERAKEMRDRGEAERLLAEGLEEGKTLEQMQVETQAAYRRPVQTPSLRASAATSVAGSGSGMGGSPASWGGSQQGELRNTNSPRARYLPDGFPRHEHPHATGAANSFPFIVPSGGEIDFANTPTPPADFSRAQPGLTDGFNPSSNTAPGFSPTDLNNPLMNGGDMTGAPFDVNGNGAAGLMGAGGGMMGFQQPFVPQDLWQMPMTFEWDWAEGMNGWGGPNGMFTPGGGQGGMFDAGGFMDGGQP
ncbi:hypothetical protein LTR53_005556 [Teratosphaeriaceae sp. CCFEE 6253]|nr:hypothetical protein LTR53_005556 [Teratosphaeriaceae sp. CCFEE 6253]